MLLLVTKGPSSSSLVVKAQCCRQRPEVAATLQCKRRRQQQQCCWKAAAAELLSAKASALMLLLVMRGPCSSSLACCWPSSMAATINQAFSLFFSLPSRLALDLIVSPPHAEQQLRPAGVGEAPAQWRQLLQRQGHRISLQPSMKPVQLSNCFAASTPTGAMHVLCFDLLARAPPSAAH